MEACLQYLNYIRLLAMFGCETARLIFKLAGKISGLLAALGRISRHKPLPANICRLSFSIALRSS